MWHSAHESGRHGGNECFDPHRQQFGGWGLGHEQHGGGWGGNGGFNARGWGGDQDCHRAPDWSADDCQDDRGWGGANDCHDGGRGLISFDHNSFLICH